jgi:hypothetical protein
VHQNQEIWVELLVSARLGRFQELLRLISRQESRSISDPWSAYLGNRVCYGYYPFPAGDIEHVGEQGKFFLNRRRRGNLHSSVANKKAKKGG